LRFVLADSRSFLPVEFDHSRPLLEGAVIIDILTRQATLSFVTVDFMSSPPAGIIKRPKAKFFSFS
jgi:hypothetical protein